jgi:hypothetical protein
MAVRFFRLVFDRDLRGAKSLFFNFVRQQPATGKSQRIDADLNGGQIGAGVDEGGERHVTANSAGAIEICGSHGAASWRFASNYVVDTPKRPP